MANNSELNFPPADFDFLKKSEKNLPDMQHRMPKELPEHQLIEKNPADTEDLTFAEWDKEGNPEVMKGTIHMEQLLAEFEKQERLAKDLLGENAEELVLELAEILDEENPLITLEETIEHSTESVEKATEIYTKWLQKFNGNLEQQLVGGGEKGFEWRAKKIRDNAAIRTLAKNRYMEALTKVWRDEPEKLDGAFEEIQFFSVFQLLTEAHILDRSQKLDQEDTVKVSQRPLFVGALSETLLNKEDMEGKLLKKAKELLPKTTDYENEGGALEAGVKAEITAAKFLQEQLEELDLEGVTDIKLRHSTQNEDLQGVDYVLTADLEGKSVVILVDVKAAEMAEAVLLENQSGYSSVVGVAGQRPEDMGAVRSNLKIPPKLEKLVKDSEGAMALVLRFSKELVEGKRKAMDQAYLKKRINNNLKYALAA